MKNLHNDRDKMITLLEETLNNLDSKSTLLDAYLYKSKTRCGRETCKCMTSNYRHENNCLSFTENGASRTRTVMEEQLEELKYLTSGYRELRQARKQLVSQYKKLIISFDREVDTRLKRGRKRLDSLLNEKAVRNG